jgi:hypothetical protein
MALGGVVAVAGRRALRVANEVPSTVPQGKPA